MKLITVLLLLPLVIAFKIIAFPFQLVVYIFMTPEQREELRHEREMAELDRKIDYHNKRAGD